MRLKRAARAGRIGVVGPGRYVDSIDWVKQTVNRRMAKGHGYYLQHAKETCLVGKKVRTQRSLCRSQVKRVVAQPTSGQRKDMWPACKRLLTIAVFLSLALMATRSHARTPRRRARTRRAAGTASPPMSSLPNVVASRKSPKKSTSSSRSSCQTV